MKKKFILFFVGFLCCNLFPKRNSFAQEVIYESELELLNDAWDKVSMDKVLWNKDGSLSLYMFTQTADSFAAGGNVGFAPGLVVYEFSDSLQFQKKVAEKVKASLLHSQNRNRSGYVKTRGSGANSAKGEKDQRSAFPDFFSRIREDEETYSAVDYLIGSPLILHTRVQYEYDWVSNSFLPVKKEERKFLLEVNTPSDGVFYIHDKILTSKPLRLVSLVSGEKKEEENKEFHHYQQQFLNIFNLEGKQLYRHALSFKSPMELRHHQFVQDQEGNQHGIVYIYGRARRYGHKITDADPSAYRVVMLDIQGAVLFEHSFQYGDRGNASEPIFAAVHQGRLFMLGKGIGKEQNFHLMTFDEEGLQNLSIIDPDLLYANTIGEYEISISHEYSSRFAPQGFRVLGNGSLLLYGEHRLPIQNARFDPESNSRIPAINQFSSYSFLHFDQEGNFLKNYVLPKGAGSNLTEPARIRFLSAKEEALRFMLAEPQMGDDGCMEYQMFQTALGDKKICKGCGAGPETAAVVGLDLKREKINCLRFSGRIFNSGVQEPFLLNNTNNELLLFTTSQSSGVPVKLSLRKIRL